MHVFKIIVMNIVKIIVTIYHQWIIVEADQRWSKIVLLCKQDILLSFVCYYDEGIWDGYRVHTGHIGSPTRGPHEEICPSHHIEDDNEHKFCFLCLVRLN